MKPSVEIAGGGIAGLTAGLAFAQKGWQVRVHEQDAALRIPGAGIYIWENGLRVLEALGVPAARHRRRHSGNATRKAQSRQQRLCAEAGSAATFAFTCRCAEIC